MNTLSKARTGSLPGVASSTDLRAHWRALLQSPRRHTLTATHHLIYQALLGRDWRRGFTPPTNTRKLANGAFTDWGLFHALNTLHHSRLEPEALAPFDGLITADTLAALRSLIPYRRSWLLRPEQFADRAFPFDAYEPRAAEEAST